MGNYPSSKNQINVITPNIISSFYLWKFGFFFISEGWLWSEKSMVLVYLMQSQLNQRTFQITLLLSGLLWLDYYVNQISSEGDFEWMLQLFLHLDNLYFLSNYPSLLIFSCTCSNLCKSISSQIVSLIQTALSARIMCFPMLICIFSYAPWRFYLICANISMLTPPQQFPLSHSTKTAK